MKESSSLIDGIASASQEQSSAIGQVSTAVREMDEMTQHNAALVEETNAAIEQTEQQANDLDKIVEIFRIEETDRPAVLDRPARRPSEPTPVHAMQDKVRKAAQSYLSDGNAAVAKDWSEF